MIWKLIFDFQYVRECQPYALTPDTHLHTNYVKNILRITEYMQSDEDARAAILSVLTERLVQLDAHIDKNEEDDVSEWVYYYCTIVQNSV